MLEAIKDCPGDIGEELTWAEKLLSVFTILTLFFVDLQMYHAVTFIAFDYLNMTVRQFWIAFVVVSATITLGLYFYFTEVVHWEGSKTKPQSASGDKKTGALLLLFMYSMEDCFLMVKCAYQINSYFATCWRALVAVFVLDAFFSTQLVFFDRRASRFG